MLGDKYIVSQEVMGMDRNGLWPRSCKGRAVVHEPWGAHPSPVQGYYDRDHPYYREYYQRTRTLADFQQWLDEWVLQVPTRTAYVSKLGEERIRNLGVKEHCYAAPVDYGYSGTF